jgi:hypothetical protein
VAGTRLVLLAPSVSNPTLGFVLAWVLPFGCIFERTQRPSLPLFRRYSRFRRTHSSTPLQLFSSCVRAPNPKTGAAIFSIGNGASGGHIKPWVLLDAHGGRTFLHRLTAIAISDQDTILKINILLRRNSSWSLGSDPFNPIGTTKGLWRGPRKFCFPHSIHSAPGGSSSPSGP